MGGTGLVLGGGGVTGVGWEIGLLTGLADAGMDLRDADLVIGTSAGSVVAAQVTSGISLTDLFERQIIGYGEEPSVKTGAKLAFTIALAVLRYGRSPERFRQQIGHMALTTDTMSEEERLPVISSRLPSLSWPAADIRVTACDAGSGEFRVFTRDDGVEMAKAVAASCAVPGVWPCVTIGERRYMDGGMRSAANADLAAGCDRVIVIAPTGTGIGPITSLAAQIDGLRAGGATVIVIEPDAASGAAIGPNPLDPSRRAAAARAGRDQAVAVAEEIRGGLHAA